MKFCAIEKSLSGKVVLITGASSGLGRELTYELARRGAQIILGCRSSEKASHAVQWVNARLAQLDSNARRHCEPPAQLLALPLNLASMQSVESFAKSVRSRFDRLHILVNNAGTMGGRFSTNAAGIEMQMAVNHLGHFHLTNLLLDVLRTSAPSRVVIVGSAYYKRAKLSDLLDVKNERTYEPLAAYARSKLANCLHGLALSRRLVAEEVGVYAVRPGFVRGTALGRHFGQLHSALLYPVMWLCSKDVQQGVQTYLHCCLAPQNELRSGALYSNCQVDRSVDDRLVNVETAEQLFRRSQQWVDDCLLLERAEET